MGGCIRILPIWHGRAIGDGAATALADSEERTLRILERAHDAYVAMDHDGIIIDWNERAEALFGWTRAEALGRAVADVIIPPHFRELHLRGLEVADGGTRKKDGHVIGLEQRPGKLHLLQVIRADRQDFECGHGAAQFNGRINQALL